jgi:hypothetical protein
MNRFEFLNILIKRLRLTSFLEITHDDKKLSTFPNIVCQKKYGVDPNGKKTFALSSDEFFSILSPAVKFGLVFVDGFHDESIVDREIASSLNHLEDGGILVVHDVNPAEERLQLDSLANGGQMPWCGTVWRSFAKLRMEREDLRMLTVDLDWGYGLIVRGEQMLFPKKELTYSMLERDRVELLNIISLQSFLSKLYLNGSF